MREKRSNRLRKAANRMTFPNSKGKPALSF
jgi:hypothetical protein